MAGLNDIALYETGQPDRPALLLSNSLGTTAEMWEPMISALSARYRVIRYDHRGHGNSTATPGPYDLADLGSDVVRLLDSLSIDSVRFAGISLGGMVGMWLAIHAPERVEELALLCTFAKVGSPGTWLERAANTRADGTRSLIESSLKRWFTDRFRKEKPDVVSRFAAMLTEVSDEGYAGCCEAIATMQIADGLSEVRAPTLVITGSHDTGATPTVGRELVGAIPDARYGEVDAAHLANVERPHEVVSMLLDHFQ